MGRFKLVRVTDDEVTFDTTIGLSLQRISFKRKALHTACGRELPTAEVENVMRLHADEIGDLIRNLAKQDRLIGVLDLREFFLMPTTREGEQVSVHSASP